jgi:hypothetical protein
MESGGPAASDLAAQIAAVEKQLAAGLATEDDLSDLEDAILAAEVADRVTAISQEIRVPLTLKKLLVDWRAAQSAAEAGLGAIGDALLADEEVQNDPRFDAVFDTVRELPDLLPSFGQSLDATVETLLSDGVKTPGVLADSLKAVADCRARLAGASVLGDLEDFAADQYGGDFRVYSPLVEALAKIDEELKALAKA